MPRRKAKAEHLKETGESHIVQFRADDLLMSQLTVLADRLRTSPGVLSRQFVAERVKKEIQQDLEWVESWRKERSPEIARKLRGDMESGPVQILHLLPLASNITINPESIRGLMSLLTPVERIGTRYSGRINVHGFITEKVFKDSTKLNGYVQIFRTGQLESVRILQQDEANKALYGDQIDKDLIRSVWSYGTAMQQLAVPPPVMLVVAFLGVKGHIIRTSDHVAPTCQIDVPEFSLPTLQITDWSQINRIESVAQTVRPALDVLWNAAGFERSSSYQENGTWRGALDARSTIPGAQTKEEPAMKEKILVVIAAFRKGLEQELKSQGVIAWCEQNDKEIAGVYSTSDDVVQWHDKIVRGEPWKDTNLQIRAIKDVRVQNAVLIQDRLRKLECSAVFVPSHTERHHQICQILRDFGIIVYTSWSEQNESDRVKRGR